MSRAVRALACAMPITVILSTALFRAPFIIRSATLLEGANKNLNGIESELDMVGGSSVSLDGAVLLYHDHVQSLQ